MFQETQMPGNSAQQVHYIAETDRLRLREVSPDDFGFLLEMFNDKEVMKFYGKVRNAEETRAWIQFSLDHYKNHGHGKWIIEKKSDGTIVGHTGLVLTNIDGKKEAELGYFLHRPFWGQGYATEAAQAVLELAREKLGYPRIVSAMDPKNMPSVAVAVRLGMKKEKSNARASVGDIKWDCEVYSITL